MYRAPKTTLSEKVSKLPLEKILKLPLEQLIENERKVSPSYFGIPFQNIANAIDLVGFFSVAIPFIHAGLVFLSTRSAEIITLRKGQTKEGVRIHLFAIFLLSFIQAIFLFFIAVNIDNPRLFIFWLTWAMMVDIVWAGVSMRLI